MIHIAFCDDDRAVLEDLSALMEQYRQRVPEMEYASFQSPLELMAAMERGRTWDVLILDVLMPGGNGVDLAQEIRNYDDQMKIIFLTSSPEYAVDSYTVGAWYYLLKPVRGEKLFPVLDRAVENCRRQRQEKLILKCKNGITAVDPDQLEYCEVIGHSLMLHLSGGQELQSKGKLDELEQKLQSVGSFLRVHRSYLVNLAYVQNISYRAVTLVCQREIPIPHGRCDEVKKAYLAYAFDKERVLL